MVRWLMKRQLVAFAPETIIQMEIPPSQDSNASGAGSLRLMPSDFEAGNPDECNSDAVGYDPRSSVRSRDLIAPPF